MLGRSKKRNIGSQIDLNHFSKALFIDYAEERVGKGNSERQREDLYADYPKAGNRPILASLTLIS